jgi:peptide deformylase
MSLLSLIAAPHPIFKQISAPVDTVDDELRAFIRDLFQTLEYEQAVGLAAPMVGVLKRIVVVDLHEGGVSNPLTIINPEITWKSEEMQQHEEASVCFAGISAEITRPMSITLRYIDENNAPQELTAEGFLASVIQHEIDYLDGITFLDHLSKLKRDMLVKKMTKYIKQHPPHVHGAGCHH